MASKREFADDIRRQYGNGLCKAQVREYLGISQHTAEKFLLDVDFVQHGRRKIYLAIDVARKIYEAQQTVT